MFHMKERNYIKIPFYIYILVDLIWKDRRLKFNIHGKNEYTEAMPPPPWQKFPSGGNAPPPSKEAVNNPVS